MKKKREKEEKRGRWRVKAGNTANGGNGFIKTILAARGT